MIEQDLLNKIIQDLSFCGQYTKFYEMLQEELDRYSDEKIEDIKKTLKFVHPHAIDKIDTYDKMKTLYEYSILI